MNNFTTKPTTKAFIAILVAWIAFGPNFASNVYAQKVVATIDADIPAQVKEVKERIGTKIASASVTIFYNALQKFTSRIAYDAANYIANGGKGQAALVFKKGPKAYFKDVGQDMAGQIIGDISDQSFFRNMGINLCAPPNPRELLNLQLTIGAQIPGLPGANQANFNLQPRCDFQQIRDNYKNLASSLQDKEIYEYIGLGLSSGGSGLGVQLSVLDRSRQLINEQVAGARDDRKESGAWKNLEDIVSGNVRTPASVIQSTFDQAVVKDPKTGEVTKQQGIIGNAYKAGAAQLGRYTASVFLNTLSSKVLNKVMSKGLIKGLVDAFKGNKKKGSVTSPNAAFVKNAVDTRLANIDLLETNILRNSEVEVLSDLYSCPDEGRNIWNCAMNEEFAQILTSQGDEGNITIGKAIQEGALKGDWQLFPASDAKQNLDPKCYTRAFCAGNLAKLRAMRIIPVGFEFAANSRENLLRCQSGGCVTLKEVVDNFGNCNSEGTRDEQHPWCKLVDPNWVLTNFPQQCQLSGYGDSLISSRVSSQRREECRDIQTCLQRDDSGKCIGGYGYCVAEKTSYRFNANQCDKNYASCRTYETRSGADVAYLRNTIDKAECTSSNVGCLGYYTKRDASGEWDKTSPMVYADKTLASCAANNAGCTKLAVAEIGDTSLNLLENGSFEDTNGAPAKLNGWTSADANFIAFPPAPAEGSASTDASKAYQLSANALSQPVPVVEGRIMTISTYVRAVTAGSASLNVAVQSSASPDDLGKIYRSSGCVATGNPGINTTNFSTNWNRLECSFIVPPGVATATIALTGDNAMVDSIQFEEGDYATNFVNGLNRSLPVAHMKVAPQELNCTGASTDPADCANYAQVCKQADAGCQGYTDLAGGEQIPAVLAKNDLCPKECVGYAEFRKEASAFDLVKDADPAFSDDADSQPAYFIPTTSAQCSQQDVGCEVFTNVELSTQGGETSAAYSYLRACRKPDPNLTRSYYIWEGSAQSGYQLRTFSLIAGSTILDGESAIGPDIVLKRGTDGRVKVPSSCNDTLWRTGADPDCRQFYDKDGNVFYRYYSQTVLSSDNCVALRITRAGQGEDCRKTGGNFNESTGECVYNAYLGESRSCRQEVAGCRAYKGVNAGAVQTVLTETFSGGIGKFSAGVSSDESVQVGGKSLKLSSSAAQTRANYPNEKDALYRVSFWAKAPGATPLPIELIAEHGSAADVEIGTVSIGSDWQRYSLGLYKGNDAATAALLISAPGIGSRELFIDEVRVERVQDTTYVVKDSWNTPIQCDTSYAGAPEPQAMLGCRAYKDTFNNTVYAHRFTRLCKQEAIGCRAFVDTRNSDSAYTQSFTNGDETPVLNEYTQENYPSNTVVRPADRMVYLKYDTSKLCQPEMASCRAFGKPVYNPSRTGVDSVETVYLKDEIVKYNEALCKPSEQFCEEFKYEGTVEYFRDPGTASCEYKEGVRLSAASFPNEPVGSPLKTLAEGSYNGWFIKGTNRPCYPEILESGSTFGMAVRGDESYRGLVSHCPASQNSCTEFRDVNDQKDPVYPAGKPYYFLNDDAIDQESCNNQVDPANGCVLLRDMSNTTLSYNTVATQKAYEKNGLKPVNPIDCTNSANATACAEVGQTDNNANMIVKIKLDRDCAQWLGCRSAETVFDPATRQYKDICIDLALCDRASDKPGDIFCKGYVDRSSSTTEPLLQTGAFFDSTFYSSREVGLGTKDYSGYAIPNTFQIPDTVAMRVGVEGLKTDYSLAASRFAQDYRLAAKVKMVRSTKSEGKCTVVGSVSSNLLARPLDSDAIGLANPLLSLCSVVTASGKQIIGFYNKSECASNKEFYCYLPVSSDADETNFDRVANIFKTTDPKSDSNLSKAFPPSECRSAPEADSPFGTEFVKAWNDVKTPSVPELVTEGFENANFCEKGQDCACTYKKASYGIGGSVAKYYAPTAQNVVPAICVGGTRDGEICLPKNLNDGTISEGEGSEGVSGAIAAAQKALSCGNAGVCTPYSKLEIIRGVFGQCLERDTTQILGTDQTKNPCLTWNPNPILFGDKDPFHYQPTAGYLPPQNAGQYYCTSYAKPATRIRLDYKMIRRFYDDGNGNLLADPNYTETLAQRVSDACEGGRADCSDRWTHQGEGYFDAQFRNARSSYVGQMKQLMFRPLDWIAEEKDNAFDKVEPKRGTAWQNSIVGATGFPTWNLCQSARSYMGANPDYTALRLVDAADGYTETFYRLNSPALLTALGAENTVESAKLTLADTNIGYISVNPTANGEVGRLACGYQSEYVDDVGEVNYGDQSSLTQGESKWRTKFLEGYNAYLSRANEKIVKDPNTNQNLVAKCVSIDKPGTSNDVTMDGLGNLEETYEGPFRTDAGTDEGKKVFSGDCHFKVWETGYRLESAEGAFDALNNGLSLEAIRTSPYRSNDSCKTSPYPWFGIRAVYQSEVNGSQNDGVWSLVGFWVSSCAGKTNADHRYMYFNIDVGTASICTELAETRSAYTQQDAAFTDRVWSQGQYRDPATGLLYSNTNAPFSSALNTGVAGKQPLFQDGGESAPFSSKFVPTFVKSGIRSYYSSRDFPRDKYAYLSNMFARVYRVYRYHNEPLLKTDSMCASGPLKGKRCTPNTSNSTVSTDCALDGVCSTTALTNADRQTTYICNKGPGKGLFCSSDVDCRGIVLEQPSGSSITLSNPCVLNTGVTQGSDGLYTVIKGSTTLSGLSVSAAASQGAFVCGGTTALNAKTSCSKPTGTAPSNECPIKTNGPELVGTCMAKGGGLTGSACSFSGSAAGTVLSANGVIQSSPVVGGAPLYNNMYIGCTENADCTVSTNDILKDQKCSTIPVKDKSMGRCVGGVKEFEICRMNDASSCEATNVAGNNSSGSCVAVASTSCQTITGGDPNATDPDLDDNACTHGVGYYPRLDLCPNPSDEYCGLVSYNRTTINAGQSLDPYTLFPLPTDVTLGHYTPSYLGLPTSVAPSSLFDYITYYTPRPPMVAAPDTRNCAVPGQCEVAQTNAFNLSGQVSGAINGGIGQFTAQLKFYAWAAHNQMPLKRIVIDWGDGQVTKLADAKIKNRKPFCNVLSECSDQTRAAGLTCNADNDCPAGAGLCKQTGVCQKQPQKYCSADAECAGVKGDKCIVRTMFGNSRDACEANYFDFQHVYTCTPEIQETLPACQISAGYCSRDASRACTTDDGCAAGDSCIIEPMAAPEGCYDASANTCRFTPRLQVMDNWGWCTGECRAQKTNGQLVDADGSYVAHPYGGCYAGAANDPISEADSSLIKLNNYNNSNSVIATRDYIGGHSDEMKNECSISGLPGLPNEYTNNLRPWVVYPGSVNVRPQ